VKSPRRYLDPELAWAIKEAKLKTGSTWRRVANYTGLSHSYLVQLSNGQRVPSRETVEVLAKWLPIEEWAVEALRDLVDRGWARDDQNVSSPNPPRYDSTGSIVPVMSHG
jgi:transcriptional regulator with XRE-family HTH domain